MASSVEPALGGEAMTYRRSTDERAVLARCEHSPGAILDQAILVPFDGSPEAERIIPVVQAFAKRLRARVQAIYVGQQAPGEGYAPVHGARAEALIPLITIPSFDPPAETIVQEAKEHRSRLIALSTGSEAAGSGRLLGHVTRDVLRLAPCPVLVMRPDLDGRYTAGQVSLARILLPLDGAPSTAAVLAREELRGWIRALKLGRGRRAAEAPNATELDILHVVTRTPAAEIEPGTIAVPRYMDQPYHEWQSWAREFLAGFSALLDYRPLDVIVKVGDPGEEIVQTALERHSDLIVLCWKGTLEGRHGAAAASVLQGAPCPVLFARIRGRTLQPA
jgi:nucleotide-binding universal stress UspA family protein